MICEPWTDSEAVGACCTGIALDDLDDRIAEAVQVASELVYVLSGKQYPGVSDHLIRPFDESMCFARTDSAYCGCRPFTRIDLGFYPVTEVNEVRLDGELVDPDTYELVDQRFLLRLAGPAPDYKLTGWPRHQHRERPLSAPGTWSIAFKAGAEPPIAGQRAATALACELVKACAGSPDCKLPGRVTAVNRQGISMSMIDPSMLAQGLTGVFETDLFLKTFNPSGLRGGALVWSPDLAPAPW